MSSTSAGEAVIDHAQRKACAVTCTARIMPGRVVETLSIIVICSFVLLILYEKQWILFPS